MIVCWSVKGGSGTTVVACSLMLLASRSRSALLVDLAGDVPTALGVPEPSTPGVSEWLASPTADADALDRLRVPISETAGLIPRGLGELVPSRWAELAAALIAGDSVVVDAGTGPPPSELVAAADHSWLVIRPCYLALRRAVALQVRPTGVVLIAEPGRSLRAADVERAVGVPVVAEVITDPAVARAVDAGLLATRQPRSLAHALRGAA